MNKEIELYYNSSDLASALENRSFRNMDIQNVKFTPIDNNGYASYDVRTSKELLNMRGVDFGGAQLSNVCFKYCNLRDANFIGARLSGVRFIDCMFDLINMKPGPFSKAGIRIIYGFSHLDDKRYVYYIAEDDIYTPLDTDGEEIIGYKKLGAVDAVAGLYISVIAKLHIPFYADRITYQNDKCRASCAEVLDIVDCNGNHYDTAYSKNCPYGNSNFKYKVGHMVYPDSFDEDPIKVCTHGIHFFMNRKDAEMY